MYTDFLVAKYKFLPTIKKNKKDQLIWLENFFKFVNIRQILSQNLKIQ